MGALITPDFSETAELKPGAYRARVAKCEHKFSQAGKQMLNVEYEVVENQNPMLNGRKVRTFYMLEGKGASRLKSFLRATLDPAYDGGQFDTDNLMGKLVNIVLKQGTDFQTGQPSEWPEVASVSRVA